MKGFKFCLHKQYFDKGFTLLNYLKYPLTIIGIGAIFSKVSVWWIIGIAAFYGLVCYILGWWWLNKGFFDAENEVQNKYNPFVREMRKAYCRQANRNP